MCVVSSCAMIIPLIASGISGGASYSLLNTAHKIETYSSQTVCRASLQALPIMDLPVQHVSEERTRAGEIEAAANERHITISRQHGCLGRYRSKTSIVLAIGGRP